MKCTVISEVLPTTRDTAGKILTRSGICTGVMINGREYGVMAASIEDLQYLADRLGVRLLKSRNKPGVWVRKEHYDALTRAPGRIARSPGK